MDQNVYEGPVIEKYKFGVPERVFAFLYFAVGYLICKSFSGAGAGLGAFITVVIIIASVAVYFSVKGIGQRPWQYAYLCVTAAFGSVYILSDNGFIKFLLTVFILFAVTFYMYFTEGSGRYEFVNDMFVFDMIKSLFIMPFCSIAAIFPAAFSSKREKKSGFKFWHVLLGLLLAVAPTAIVAYLLISADAGFSKIMKNVADFFSKDVWSEVIRVMFGVPLAMLLFGAVYANVTGRCRGALTKEQREGFLKAVSFLPRAAAYAAVTPLCVLYVIFLTVQAKYYFGGFSADVPAGMTYAEYARSGFFELCAVAVINALIIIALTVFTKKKEDGKSPVSLKICSVVLCCFTLLLIAVAISKMAVYIGGYGLTRLRVYTSWFMILLAFAFVFLIIRQFARKFNFFACLTAVFVVWFGVLCFCDVDARIAEYNVNIYMTQKDASIDMNELANLSDSAVPYIEKLTTPKDDRVKSKKIADHARMILADKKVSKEKSEGVNGVIYFNLPQYRAEQVTGKY